MNIDFPETPIWKKSLLGHMEGRLKQVRDFRGALGGSGCRDVSESRASEGLVDVSDI